MKSIQAALESSLDDFSVSRNERKQLKQLLAPTQGNQTEQAKVRQLAFSLATAAMQNGGSAAAMDWLEDVIKILYASEMKVKASAYFSPGEDCLHRIRRLIGEASATLDICVFTITDNRIVRRLEEAIARGVAIRIISDDLNRRTSAPIWTISRRSASRVATTGRRHTCTTSSPSPTPTCS